MTTLTKKYEYLLKERERLNLVVTTLREDIQELLMGGGNFGEIRHLVSTLVENMNKVEIGYEQREEGVASVNRFLDYLIQLDFS